MTLLDLATFSLVFHHACHLPTIGFLAGGRAAAAAQTPKLEAALAAAQAAGSPDALKAANGALARNRIIRFNAQFDWMITALFLGFAAVLFVLSVATWLRLLSGRLVAHLSEDPPSWLPEGVLSGAAQRPGLAGAAALAIALLRVCGGQTEVDREAAQITASAHRGYAGGAVPRLLIDVPEVRDLVHQGTAERAYVRGAEQRLAGVRRCC